MYRIVYLSSASPLYSDEALKDILTVSRRNNEQSGITGILLYHEGSILQVLEGDELKVTNCYHRILFDDRHKGAMIIMEGACEQRYFEKWSMGFQQVNDAQWDTVSGYFPVTSESVQFENKNKSAQDLVTFIGSFCNSSFRF
ncbi:MAG: BLUF domain-containing protein [Chitinophagaceae bacterium]